MGANGLDEYWVPEHVKDYLRKLGFVLPLDDMEPWIRSWNEDGILEYVFVTRAFHRGKAVDQLQMHLRGPLGTYRISTVCFDSGGNVIEPESIIAEYDTGSAS